MRSFAIAAFVAAANAFPALYDYNMGDAPAAPVNHAVVTVTDVTEVYTTVYGDEAAPAPTVTKKYGWKHRTTQAAPVAVVTYTAPAPAAYTPAAAPAPAPAAPAPVAAAPAAAPSDYASTVVAHHNAHRANHSAPALEWDDALAATALKIANSCVYAHDT